MGRTFLLPEAGSFYKANLHCHTVLSDGCLTPEEVKHAYQEQGYSIVAYTDHNFYRYHRELCDENFLAIAALEANIDAPTSPESRWNTTPVYHLNFYDTDPDARGDTPVPLPEQHYDAGYVNSYIAEMNRLGFLCCYNHPCWSLQTREDYLPLEGLAAFELYNYGCEHDGLYGYAPRAYDDLLRAGRRVGCFATDDNHNRLPFGDPLCDSFGGFTMIRAARLDYGSVMEAIKSRSYYASMGPELYSLSVENGTLFVECSPVEKIYVHNQGRDSCKLLAGPGETLTHAEFPLTGNEGYIRVDCRDALGRHADSCAYFTDEFFTEGTLLK